MEHAAQPAASAPIRRWMEARTLGAALGVVLALAGAVLVAQSIWWPAAPAALPGYRTVGWPDLVPAGWSPLPGADPRALQMADDDPRAQRLMADLRLQLDQAPASPALDGAQVGITGYVVPLEMQRDGLREFLLVPYHGACIHTPPPPANQIVHVVLAAPATGIASMDVVQVRGVLQVGHHDSAAGTSAYRMAAVRVDKHRPSLGG